MSWLSGIASRTENLLNTLDRGAATALKKPKPAAKSSFTYDAEKASSMPSAAAAVPAMVAPSSRQGTPTATATARRRPDPDEQLIAFLNDTTPVKTSSDHSRQSSVSSVASVGNFISQATAAAGSSSDSFSSLGNGASTSNDPGTPHQHQLLLTTPATARADSSASDTSITIPSSSSAPGGESANHCEPEQIRMLQKEISNMSREMAHLLQRTKLSEKEGTRLKYQLTTSSDQLTEAERQCRHLQQRQTDLTEALRTKDGQLAVLKVRLDEADGELRSRQGAIDRLQLENDRILQSSCDASGLQSGTIQGLQDRLQEAEARLRQHQQQMEAERHEHERRLEQLSSEQASLTAELAAARQQLQQQLDSCAELHKQLAEQRTAADAASHQLAQYKLKAQRILQTKDQLIADLKGEEGTGATSDQLRDAELLQMRSERELAQTEVQQLAATVEQLREELQQADASAQQQVEAAAEAARDAAASQADLRRLRAELEHELEQTSQETRFLREEMVRQKTEALSRLQQREDQIEKLRRQITSKHVASSTEVELESRLRSLTENLIQKQTNIESLNTQNRCLAVQLERAQAQIEQQLGGSPGSERVPVPEPIDSLRQRASPTLFAETPWDGTVTRRVKRAYSSLDSCSIRIGLFLRRYPIARIFVIGYMCLLHLWVMLVLFTYTPEIHGDQHQWAAAAAGDKPA